jgi:hypothetical protein
LENVCEENLGKLLQNDSLKKRISTHESCRYHSFYIKTTRGERERRTGMERR